MNESKVLSIVSLVIGILAILSCCILGVIPGAIGVIISIVAIVKESKGRALSIVGLVLSLVSIIISIVCFFFLKDAIHSEFENILKPKIQSVQEVDWGEKYTVGDGCVYFNNDGSFEWFFMNDGDYDNSVDGSYELLSDDDAKEWFVNEHPEYGITEEEFDSTEDSILLLLHGDEVMFSGETASDDKLVVLFGDVDDDGDFHCVNIDTFTQYAFYKEY